MTKTVTLKITDQEFKDLFLHDKNREVLQKAENGEQLSPAEQKLLYRTKQVIAEIAEKKEFNKQYEDVVQRLFF